jgi:flagellar hook-length control protein FliK
VASHLTIISGPQGSASARGFGGSREAGESGGMLGLFAALLNSKPAEAAAAANANGTGGEAKGEVDLSALFQLGLDAASGDAGGDADDADAIAAALDLNTGATIPADPVPMVDFVDALGALKASLDRGEPLDPDLLAKVDAALTGLADALGIDLASLPVPEDFAALLANTGADDTGLAGTLNRLLSPLAQSLAGAQPADGASAIAGEAAARDQLKALGDRLAALLAALEEGAVSDEKLAAIGMKPGAPPAEEIETALARFAASLQADADIPDEPVLAAPSLKTSEKTLTGKSDANSPSDTPLEPAKPNDSAPVRDERKSDAPQREARPAPAAPAVNDNGAPPPATASAQQDQSALRLEAVGTKNVVQSGYQTSQQQLNLPQLAFELARQVQDGNSRFQIRLDPPELGRIDVRLDIDKSGQVNARLTVEKSETLDLMQRDQRALERALQQAGLDNAKTNLEFSLKQNPFAGQGERHDRGEPAFRIDDLTTTEAEEAPPTVNLYRGSLQASGVNIIA